MLQIIFSYTTKLPVLLINTWNVPPKDTKIKISDSPGIFLLNNYLLHTHRIILGNYQRKRNPYNSPLCAVTMFHLKHLYNPPPANKPRNNSPLRQNGEEPLNMIFNPKFHLDKINHFWNNINEVLNTPSFKKYGSLLQYHKDMKYLPHDLVKFWDKY